jgi:two-component system, chemotaxis family, protein-glutamate methylesterase/glutaminase
MTPIRTLVVDDSAFVRKIVAQMLGQSPSIEVIGMARDGEDALEMTARLKPDVITCDLTMPRVDGVEFVRTQMERSPVPILILSASPKDGDRVMEALAAGALDFIQKPSALANEGILAVRDQLIDKVRAAASAAPSKLPIPLAARVTAAPPILPPPRPTRVDIVLLGTSTGGPQALRQLIPQFPADFPVPIVMVLHMPVGYTTMFARKLDDISQLRVVVASNWGVVEPGTALLAPAGWHLKFRRQPDGEVQIDLDMAPMDKAHRPSVDVMFQSASQVYGSRTMAVVMTGMGDDGKIGAAWIKGQGGMVITESEESCVIYGMPRTVVEAGFSDLSVPLESMAATITKRL